MLTTTIINGMLNVIQGYANRITIVSDALEAIDVDDFLYDHTSKQISYTNTGNQYITIHWNSASGRSKSLNTSANSTPIMFAIKSVATPTHLVFFNATNSKIFAIDELATKTAYNNDGPFYMYAYSIEMEESE